MHSLQHDSWRLRLVDGPPWTDVVSLKAANDVTGAVLWLAV
jgi:hypothetical protein